MRRALLCGLLALAGCDDGADPARPPDLGAPDAQLPDAQIPDVEMSDGDLTDTGALDAERPDEGLPLQADAGISHYAWVDEAVSLDGGASTGAVAYQWDLGDGSPPTELSADPTATVVYTQAGRFRATLTAFDAEGASRRDQVVISVTARPTHSPTHSDTVTWLTADRLAALVTDDDAVVLVDRLGDGFALAGRLDTADAPRSLSAWVGAEGPRLAVACQGDEVVQIFSADGLLSAVQMPRGSRPFGVVADAARGRVYVTLQGTGEIATLLPAPWRLEGRAAVAPDLRGLALLPDGALAATRWRTDGLAGEIWRWDPDGEAPPTLWPLAFDPQQASDTEIGGVPSYLDHLVASPQGDALALPSLQANYAHGSLTSGRPPAPDEVLRAVISFIDLDEGVERFAQRKQFDGRGLASTAVYSSRGDYLYVSMRGSRTVERLDQLTENQSGTLLDAGRAVEGLALTADDRFLLANATLDRQLNIYDVRDLTGLPLPIQQIPLVEVEPLDPLILLGKQLFNDSADPRLSAEGYIACAHCHLDGDSDHLTWDFSDRGEGLRQTISLLGRSGTGHGPLHWSANFDEGQDFEHDLRGPFGGEGLMSDADFHSGGRDDALGAPKAGLSAELDALAAYMTSLSDHLPSPHRQPDGALSPAAARGMALFFDEAVGCAECHTPPRMTDSAWTEGGAPLLHDVGTLSAASGQRRGGPLGGLDTPTLHGLWHSAPYLHDGSAPTLRAALVEANPGDAHGATAALDEAALSDLEAYLLSLDGDWQ